MMLDLRKNDLIIEFFSRNLYLSIKFLFLLLGTSFHLLSVDVFIVFGVLTSIKALIDQNESIRLLGKKVETSAINKVGLYAYLAVAGFAGYFIVKEMFPLYFLPYENLVLLVILLGEIVKPFNYLFAKNRISMLYIACVQCALLLIWLYKAQPNDLFLIGCIYCLDFIIAIRIVLREKRGFTFYYIFEPFVLLMAGISYGYSYLWLTTSEYYKIGSMSHLFADKEKWIIVFTLIYPVFRLTGVALGHSRFMVGIAVGLLSFIVERDIILSALVSYIVIKMFLQSDSYHERQNIGLIVFLGISEAVLVLYGLIIESVVITLLALLILLGGYVWLDSKLYKKLNHVENI